MTPISVFTYTILSNKKLEDGRKMVIATLAAGNGSLTYPAGGIAVSAGAFGFASGVIESLKIVNEAGDFYIYRWNKSTGKIMSYVESGTAHHVMEDAATSATPTIAITVEAIGY